jgi:DNA polymerase IV (DinB-like DNA polymerase)
MTNNKIIFHVDMDSFFASVEIRERPELKGKPVVVGADPKEGLGRGVVSTCSYEARAYGIHSGMPISTAYRLCPDAVFLRVDFTLYRLVSENVMHILRSYSKNMIQVSIDEAYLDLTDVGSFEVAGQLAGKIKQEIHDTEQITCSIGIGPSRLVAKIASDFQKPNGLTVVDPAHVVEFLSPLPVEKIPGIGKKTGAELKSLGISTVSELADYDIQLLRSRFGKWGVHMHDLAKGKDIRGLIKRDHRKSISREITYGQDTDDNETILQTLDAIAEDVHSKIVQEGLSFKTITIKVRYIGFITHTKSRTLDHYTNDNNTIKEIAKSLLQTFLNAKKIRLIGIRLSNFDEDSIQQRMITDFIQSDI